MRIESSVELKVSLGCISEKSWFYAAISRETYSNGLYQVDTASLDPAEVEITHVSLNDGSLEGMRLRRKPVFCVQYHPEAAPGPHDAHGLFDEFVQLVRIG